MLFLLLVAHSFAENPQPKLTPEQTCMAQVLIASFPSPHDAKHIELLSPGLKRLMPSMLHKAAQLEEEFSGVTTAGLMEEFFDFFWAHSFEHFDPKIRTSYRQWSERTFDIFLANKRRELSKRMKLFSEIAEERPDTFAKAPFLSPEMDLDLNLELPEDGTLLQEALALLSPRQKKLIDERFFRGWTHQQSATAEGVTRARVQILVEGAMDLMRRHIENRRRWITEGIEDLHTTYHLTPKNSRRFRGTTEAHRILFALPKRDSITAVDKKLVSLVYLHGEPALKRSLQSLDSLGRFLIYHQWFEHRTLDEIARALDLDFDDIKEIHKKALETLSRSLAKHPK